VAAVIGSSDAALRFPSLVAMTVAAGFTAAIGRRSASMAGGPWPSATGLAAGLAFAVMPYVTYYAQMARSYAFVTMFATVASYLLLRALSAQRCRWWWAGYGLAVALTGLFNTFGLLILLAHAVTLLWTARLRRGWLLAAAASVAVLVPLLLVSYRQRGQISWMTKPTFSTVATLVKDFAGSKALVLPVALLALAGVAAVLIGGAGSGGKARGVTGGGPGSGASWRRMSPAAIALPWLVVPPVILLAGSEVKPAYSPRYVEFCLPALAILVAAGLAGLIHVLAGTPLGSVRLGRRGLARPAAASSVGLAPGVTGAWAAGGLVVIVLGLLLISPQQAIRQTSARPDDLRGASAIVAANEQPGDVVFYIPVNMRVLGTGYPEPFRKLRDLALYQSAVASGTLAGREYTDPARIAALFTDAHRVWVVTGNNTYKFPVPSTAADKQKLALLSGMHIVRRWMAGEVMLTLYSR
jgi:mannosyltransferase